VCFNLLVLALPLTTPVCCRVGREEDAHEFLMSVLQAMQKQYLTAHGVQEHLGDRMPETTLVHQM
jgi:hypothetical protein